MDWNDHPAKTAELRIRWAAGESVRSIGRALGITHNAVVGKVRRLHLPLRARRAQLKPPQAATPGAPPPTPPPPPLPSPVSPPQRLRVEECRWILGKAQGAGSAARGEPVFCAAPVRVGQSYCPEHHARCYQRVRKSELMRTAAVD
jgi:hypothetical protein